MPRANLKSKTGSVFMNVAKPAENTRQWREVPGVIMEAGSQENINNWWDVFTEMARECPDWKSLKKGNR